MNTPTPLQPDHVASLLLAVLISAIAPACDDAQRSESAQRQSMRELFQQPPPPPQPGRPIVAEVDGTPIYLDTLQRAVQHPQNRNRTKAQVLDELILAVLLQEDLLQSSYADDPRFQDLHSQLSVQAYLRAVIEEPNSPSTIPTQDARAYYDSHPELYQKPEIRTVDHLLVAPSTEKWGDLHNPKTKIPDEVFERTQKTLETLRAELLKLPQPVSSEALQAFAESWRPKISKDLEIVVDVDLPTPRRAFGTPGKPGFIPSTVEPFAAKTFALQPGAPPSEPVRTQFGTHTILLRKVLPKEVVPFEETQDNIKQFLAMQRRADAFQLKLKTLLSTANPTIQVDRDAVAKLSGAKAQRAPNPTPKP